MPLLGVDLDPLEEVANPGDSRLERRVLQNSGHLVHRLPDERGRDGQFGCIRDPLVRFFEPLTVGPLSPAAARDAVVEPLIATGVEFDPDVVRDIVELSGGRPYYLQRLAYHSFDSIESGRLSMRSFGAAFDRAFAAISQEIFAARWAGMSIVEQRVLAFLARSEEPRASSEVEWELASHAVRPGTTRQSLRRLTARGQITRSLRQVVADIWSAIGCSSASSSSGLPSGDRCDRGERHYRSPLSARRPPCH